MLVSTLAEWQRLLIPLPTNKHNVQNQQIYRIDISAYKVSLI